MFKILDGTLVGALEGGGEVDLTDSAADGEHRCGVACEGVLCGEPDVARGGGVAALDVGILEEGEQMLTGKIGEVGLRTGPLRVSREEDEQELERVAERKDRVTAKAADAGAIVSEETAQG